MTCAYLANGDYVNLLADIITTLKADTGTGGLSSPPDPAVASIETKARNEARDYNKSELPVIVPFLTGDTESHSPDLDSEVKVFHVSFNVMTRCADRDVAVLNCQKITARLKKVIREQTKTSKLWNQAPTPAKIEGGQGTLVSQILETSTYELSDDEELGSEEEFSILMVVQADIVIPVEYDYYE